MNEKIHKQKCEENAIYKPEHCDRIIMKETYSKCLKPQNFNIIQKYKK